METLLWVCHTYCQPVSAVSSWLRSSATRPALSALQRRQRRARWWCCLLLYCAWGWPVKYGAKVAVNVYRFFLFNMSKCHCHVFCVKYYVCFRLLCPKGIKKILCWPPGIQIKWLYSHRNNFHCVCSHDKIFLSNLAALCLSVEPFQICINIKLKFNRLNSLSKP